MRAICDNNFCAITVCFGALCLCWIIDVVATAPGLQIAQLHPPPGHNLNPPLRPSYESDYHEDDYEDYENYEVEPSDDEGSTYDWPDTQIPSTTSTCSKVRATLEARHITEAYIPKCLGDGEYAPVQCSNTTSCYCVNLIGQEVPGTRISSTNRKLDPDSFDCSHIDRKRPIMHELIPSDIFPPTDQISPDWPTDPIRDDQSLKGIDPKTGASIDSTESEGALGVGESRELGTSYLEGEVPETSLWLRLVSDKKKLSIVVVATLCVLLFLLSLITFLIFRLRKKDEGSYRLDEPKASGAGGATRSQSGSYLTPLNQDKEFFA